MYDKAQNSNHWQHIIGINPEDLLRPDIVFVFFPSFSHSHIAELKVAK